MRKVALLLSCVLIVFFHTEAAEPQQTSAVAGRAFLVSDRSQTTDHGGQVESKYDGFGHETVVTLKKMKVTCASKKGSFKGSCVNVLASLHCPGIQLDYVRYATLQLIFETEDWDQRHPLGQRQLTVVADGETLRLGRMELVGQSVDTLMSEALQLTLSYDTFKKIALAKTVEIQVGKSRFDLREKNLAALRDLNNRVKF